MVKAIEPFHDSKSFHRVLAGPNRGGKTTAGSFELVSYATGFNPIRNESYSTPNVTWAVCVEYKSAGRVMFRKLGEMLPRKANGARNWTYYKQDHLIVLGKPYGSEIHIKSQKEGESSLLAEGCHAIWVDEAVGGEVGLENFGELRMRRIPGQPLFMFFTLTPKIHTGIEWMRQRLWVEPGETPHESFIPGTFCLRYEAKDCLVENGGFWTQEDLEMAALGMDEDEKEARLKGRWTPFMERPAFSYKLLLRALDRAPVQMHVKPTQRGFKRFLMEETSGGPCKLMRERESGHSYIAAWDPSSGLGKGHDPSALVVFDRGDLTECFHAESDSLGPDQFAREIAVPTARYFNDAMLVPEVNGEGGAAALQALRETQYPNLYMQKSFDKLSATYTDKVGWRTTDQTRGKAIDALKRALEEDRWTPSRDLLEQMTHIVRKRINDRVRIEHAQGFHDDLVLAAAIALAVHYEEPIEIWPDLNKLRIRYGPEVRTQVLGFG